ncbi:MAG: S26 family signal peptidase [Candidatus Tectimicrobiota bacterium]
MGRELTWLDGARPSMHAETHDRPAPRHGVVHRRARRPLLLGLVWWGMWAGSAGLWQAYGPRLLLNLTPSMACGVYRVGPVTSLSTLTHGRLVAFPPPDAVAVRAVRRGYLAPQTPLLKPVAALPGETVCVHDDGVVIQGQWVAPVAAVDTRGRPLPRWRGCLTLRPNEVFPLSLAPRSFDGRYFGPVALGSLLGQAQPLWTWGVEEVSPGRGERGQDKGTPYTATLPKPNQALGTRHGDFLPSDTLTAPWFPRLTPRHPVVAGEERGHGD